MTPFQIRRNDTAPALSLRLRPASTVLTGATVVFSMREQSSGTAKVSRQSATIVTATGTPEVKYTWQTGDTDTAGTYDAEFEVTFADGTIRTFPRPGLLQVNVAADIA